MELLSPRRPEILPLSNKPICTVTVLVGAFKQKRRTSGAEISAGERPSRKQDPKGRLNLAQDAVLGWQARLKSPAGTTENSVETLPWILGADRKFSIPDYFDWKGLGLPPANSSRPYGTFRLSNSLPRTASWANFSRPCGTHFAIGRFSRTHFSPRRPSLFPHGRSRALRARDFFPQRF
jgi:hypothetical protein